MTAPQPDYLTDHDYPPVFHPEQAPGWLAAVLAALGHPAPARGHWCELGCGEGVSAALLAAANPDMRFTGIDLNPRHIATARARAKAAGLDNLEFHCADLRDPQGLAGPFDMIVTHGVLSWVGPEVRATLAAFIAPHLAPGGVAAVQYMSEPGGAAFRAFHAVFRACAGAPDPVAEGLARLAALREAKAGFFQMHAHAAQTLDNLLTQPPGYIRHEYMNATFQPLAFGEVAGLFSDRGLVWRGSATPLDNIDAASIPEQAARSLAGVRDTVLRETMKDLARNQALRYDLFTRPKAPAGDEAHLALLRGVVWALLPGAPPPAALTFTTPIGPVEADPRLYAPLLTRLAQGPARFGDIETIPPFAGRPGLLNQALQMALWAGIAHPLGRAPGAPGAARLNRLLLAEAAQGARVPALCAAPLGSGRAVTPAQMADLGAGGGPQALRALFGLDRG